MEIKFTCKCGGNLKLEENGYEIETFMNPYAIGTISKKRIKIKATCQCGYVDEDYFKL